MTDFPLPPEGMLSEQIDLPDHRLSLGLVHPEGRDITICAWDGERWRYLTSEAAISWAQDMESDRYSALFAPVTEALRSLVAKVAETDTLAMMRRVSRNVMRKYGDDGFADMPVEGHA